jgi:hypothetical protein
MGPEGVPGSERGTGGTKKDNAVMSSKASKGVHKGLLRRRTSSTIEPAFDDVVTKSLMTTSSVAPGVQAEGIDPSARVQALVRPFDLDVIAPVQATGSDPSSEEFAMGSLPDLLDYIESNVVYCDSNEEKSTEASLTNLTLAAASPIRVYFVADDALYHNSIGLFTAESADGEMVPELVFPDASSAYSYYKNVKDKTPTADLPLVPGDFVDIGLAEAGSSLDLFVIPDGARQGQEAYGITKELNADKLSHARILGVVGDSMILVGFEDLTDGGDRDYDDVILAVEVGKENVRSISARLGL